MSNSIEVSTGGELNQAITSANSATGDTSITLMKSFTLNESIYPINTDGTVTINTFTGNNIIIDGADTHSGFVILKGVVTFENLTIKNMSYTAQPGCLAYGAGMLVAHFPSTPAIKAAYPNSYGTCSVTLVNVYFENCGLQGGLPNPAYSGGGGGGGQAPGSHADGNPGGHGYNGQGATSQPSTKASRLLVTTSSIATGSYFGVVGNGGTAGTYGGGGGGGSNCDNFCSHGGGAGWPGNSAGSGGFGGYGASCGNGGGGGGGGGGGSGGVSDCNTGSGGTGGHGAAGAATLSIGFGGGPGAPLTGGASGQGGQNGNGGEGGQGGTGATGNGGAALGAGLFVMDNATLAIRGSGGTSTNTTTAGPYGTMAGAGMFFQGSGSFDISVGSEDTYIISDEIADEAGAVANSNVTAASVVASQNGPDGFLTGGGSGVWKLNKSGSGTLTISGNNFLSGVADVKEGTLDLTGVTRNPHKPIIVRSGAHLIHKPNRVSRPRVSLLTLESGASLHLNSTVMMTVKKLTIEPGAILALDPEDFVVGQKTDILMGVFISGSLENIEVGNEFSVQVEASTLAVTRLH